jgi:Tfp pilus assembly protein PilN
MEVVMFGFLTLGRVQLYIAVAVILTGFYFYWKHSVEQQALMEYNQRQLEQSIADQNKLKETLSAIEQKQQEIIKQNEQDKVAYEQKLGTVTDYLDSSAAKKTDKPSSDILKQTVKQLKEITK